MAIASTTSAVVESSVTSARVNRTTQAKSPSSITTPTATVAAMRRRGVLIPAALPSVSCCAVTVSTEPTWYSAESFSGASNGFGAGAEIVLSGFTAVMRAASRNAESIITDPDVVNSPSCDFRVNHKGKSRDAPITCVLYIDSLYAPA